MLYNAGLTLKLRQILDQDKLRFVFQPIVDIARSTVLGYEALMRGPAGTPLERPDELLRMAKACNLGLELEAVACKG
ncbi:MAG: EAL domain-containing protein, partial [Thauera sp.]|nr:EAL domain-containing protein [Thauera sp.]